MRSLYWGSMWMSLARSSMARCRSQLVSRTIGRPSDSLMRSSIACAFSSSVTVLTTSSSSELMMLLMTSFTEESMW